MSLAPHRIDSTPPLDRVGRYRLIREIASGGMASVYLALSDGQPGFERVVALKRIRGDFSAEPEMVAMFLDEARLAVQIHHPNVCGVIDFGREDDAFFMAMEFVFGVTVARCLRDAKLREIDPVTWVRFVGKVLIDAAEGLHAAHQLRDGDGAPLHVVHRDVSPQNLMIGFDGAVRVLDFGVARSQQREVETRTGQLKGKTAYMAPEQIRSGEVGPYTDTFALGVVGWEMLAQKRLFRRATDAETMYAVLHTKAPDVREEERAVPRELADLIAKALSPDRRERFGDAREFGREVARALRPLGGPAELASVAELLATIVPGEAERQREMIELARQGLRSSSGLVRRDSTGSSALGASRAAPGTEGAASPTSGESVLSLEDVSGISLSSSRGAVPEPAPLRPSVVLGAAALVGAVAAALSVVAVATMSGGPRENLALPRAPGATEASSPERAATTRAPVGEPRGALDPSAAIDPGAMGVEHGGGGAAEVHEGAVDAPRELDEGTADVPPPGPRDDSPVDPHAGSGVASSDGPSASDGPSDGPRRPRAVREPGMVVIVTPGTWAEVFDARHTALGPTPLRVSLPPGATRLSLAFHGEGAERVVPVEVRSGEVVRLSIRDDAQAGRAP